MRAAPTPNSANGSKSARGLASTSGKPKSVMALREPLRSESFAKPATMKTAASTRRAIKRAASIRVSFLWLL
jgi:hypothetical protein